MTDINWTQMREEILKDFSLTALPPTIKLPALPHAVMKFTQRSSDPKVELKELAQIIETDTGLTVELLRYVNSTYVGLRNKARNVQQALSLLGQRQSKIFLLATGTQAAVQAKQSKLINQATFWNASLQKAIFAKEVATLLRADGDVAFAGAMLQDFLLPVLTNESLDVYLEFTGNRKNYPELLTEFETTKFGWNHCLAGACLATRWQLPDDLVCCILFHHLGLHVLANPKLNRTPVAAVALSALLPDVLRQSFHGLEQLVLLQSKWPAFNLQQLVETVDAKHQELGMGLVNDFPLSRRCRMFLEPQASADAADPSRAAPATAAAH